MPYINTTTNTPIPADKMEQMKQKLGEYSAIIGKSEDWLMVNFCENSPLWFKGTNEPAAMVAVSLYGAAAGDAYTKFTAAVTALLGDTLGIEAARVFVSYAEFTNWGWSGSNF